MIIKMILTNAFDPDPRVYKEAITLVNHGHDVEVLAWDRESKFFESPIEVIEGIKIKRFFSKGKYGSGVKQVFGYLRFIKEVSKYLRQTKFDFIHCHDFDTLILGYLLKKKNNNFRLVYDEHDLFYLYFENRGKIYNLFGCLIKNIESVFLNVVDYHVVVTPNMQKLYKNKTNSFVITNAPLKDSFQNVKKIERKKIVIGFIGIVRYFEELKVLLDVSNSFKNIEVFIAGKGTKLDAINSYTIQTGYKNVQIYGKYKVNQLEKLYSNIDITYLIYPSKDSKISLPNKFFESIITETPIIADERSEYGQIIKEYSIGWTIDSEDLGSSLKKVIQEVSNNPEIIIKIKENMKKIKKHYYWESNIRTLCEIYKKTV